MYHISAPHRLEINMLMYFMWLDSETGSWELGDTSESVRVLSERSLNSTRLSLHSQIGSMTVINIALSRQQFDSSIKTSIQCPSGCRGLQWGCSSSLSEASQPGASGFAWSHPLSIGGRESEAAAVNNTLFSCCQLFSFPVCITHRGWLWSGVKIPHKWSSFLLQADNREPSCQ